MQKLSNTWSTVSTILVGPWGSTLTDPADFYHLDYLNKPLSRQTSQRSTRPHSPSSVTSRFSKRSPPKKLNLAFLEDPLLAQMSAASPLTPPAEETLFQPLDVSLKLPDTPMAEQFADDYIESVTMEPEVDVESAHLVTHAKVYAIAEKYVPPSVIFPPLVFPFLFPGVSAIRECAMTILLRCVAPRFVSRRKASDTPRRASPA
jgi:hypothetical protein